MVKSLMDKSKLLLIIDDASLALLQAKEGEANVLLSKVFDELLVLSSLLDSDSLKALSQIMQIMHDAQQRRDHIYLVDILRYELPKHINLALTD